MFRGEGNWVSIIAFILLIVLAYNILRNWQGAVAITNSTFTGGANTIKALQGR